MNLRFWKRDNDMGLNFLKNFLFEKRKPQEDNSPRFIKGSKYSKYFHPLLNNRGDFGIGELLGTTLFSWGGFTGTVAATGEVYAIGATVITLGDVLGVVALGGSLVASLCTKSGKATTMSIGGLMIYKQEKRK
jgi:hypothetical protein